MKKVLAILLLLSSHLIMAQSSLTENTLQLDDPTNQPKATVEDLSWMVGHWTGKGFGGLVEESWNPAMGGSMIGSFRLVKSDKPSFYEMLLLTAANGSVAYQVKHFNPDFSGWEEKDDFVSFPLVKLEANKAYFQGLTVHREDDQLTHYLAMEKKDGSYEEIKLTYQLEASTTTPAVQDFLEKFKLDRPKTQLMLLGSYHMSNPGADQFNLESDDVLLPKRQAEIEDVVKKLAEFKPTKIAIEAPFGDSATLARYQNYLAGTHELRRSEEEQIGFRLAKMLGHQSIYPIDVRMSLDQPGLEQVIGADPAKHGPRMAALQQMGETVIRQMAVWLKEGTVGDMLYTMNQPEFLDMAYQMYLQIFLPTVHEDNYAGADLVSVWNQRNFRIMSNLHQIDCTPEDRILIVYGQGHVPLFERIAEDSPYFELVSVLPFLR